MTFTLSGGAVMGCGCNGPTLESYFTSLASNGVAAASKIFVPISRPFNSGRPAMGRVDLEILALTGDLRLMAGVRLSSDGQTWGTPSAVGPELLAAGMYRGQWFNIISDADSSWYAQLGLFAYNYSTSDNQFANVRLMVGLKMTGSIVPA